MTPPEVQFISPDITATTDVGSPGTVVTWPDPVATDNSGGTVTVQCNPSSGSVFPPGTRIVICTFTDPSGNQVSRAFTVTVNTGMCFMQRSLKGESALYAILPSHMQGELLDLLMCYFLFLLSGLEKQFFYMCIAFFM